MEELYSIMRDFLEVEYNQESLLCLLKAVESVYTDEKQAEARLITNSTKYYLTSSRKSPASKPPRRKL